MLAAEMQALLRTLQDHDLGHLRIIAELWGVELAPGTVVEASRSLAQAMLDPSTAHEQIESLPLMARQSLDFLLLHNGRLPCADLARRFGPLREMGPGRRDREKPWRQPESPLEVLWYRGLIARAFADSPSGPQEFAFVPSDLMLLLPTPSPASESPLGRAIHPPAWHKDAATVAVDDATTLLAALRRRASKTLPLPPSRSEGLAPFVLQPAASDLLLVLLHQEGLISGPPYHPAPEAIRPFLDSPRVEALRILLLAWLRSRAWNDLEHVPHLQTSSGEWPNDPRVARQALTGFLGHVPVETWWDLDAFVEGVREHQPGFQRPAGDFDSWYLQDERSGIFLRGFEHWDAVEGALLRTMITGPLHWLGITDLGGPSPEVRPTAFRLTSFAEILLDPGSLPRGEETTGVAHLRPDGRLVVPLTVSRALRYQIARFTAWEHAGPNGYRYRLTPSSLQAAKDQGLQITHIRSVLQAATTRRLPDALVQALKRWETQRLEARLERPLVLHLSSGRVLTELKRYKATARYLGNTLGPSAVVLEERDLERFCAAAARLGLLIDPPSPADPEGAP